MFIIIPHRSTLALGRRPYVTWGMMALCLLIHLLAPASPSLMYYPDSWNPLTMISSSLAHASWLHLVGNLLFFYAFSPMLEEAVANRIRYLLILLAMMFVTSISYSVFSVFADENIPSLGLSGVVMGVIGLAAYMMPRAKIHTFIWFVTVVKNYYIAVWALALWFIGWDILDLYAYGQNSGINLIAHVSGGLSGYLIGYFFLAEHKKEIKHDVEEAIEYARSEYQDNSSMASTYSGQRGKMIEDIRAKDANRVYGDHIAQIYKHVDLGNDAEAIILMLQDSEENQFSVEIYDELFERMIDWPPSRTLMCTARFCIDLYMHKRIYLRPLEIVRHCYSISDEFVLADPMHVLILAKQAMSHHDYETAYAIVKNAVERYGEYINHMLCILLEIELLYIHLNQQEKAKTLLKTLLLSKHSKQDQSAIMALAKAMQD